MSIILNIAMATCFVAGKSGGHILPCITKAEQIIETNQSKKVYLFSTGTELDKKILNKHPKIDHIIPSKLDDVPYQQLWKLPIFTFNLAIYLAKSIYNLWKIKPEKVISFGGFNSIPVYLAAKILFIPFEVYELNVEPGKATKLLSYFTDTIFICFEKTKKYFPNKKCIKFNYPVRFKEKDKKLDLQLFHQKYNFSPTRTTILILGGSQGSILLNKTFLEAIQNDADLKNKIQVIHQTGATDPTDYKSIYNKLEIPSIVFSYHEQLQDFYVASDLIISRAGAGTLFEIKFFNKKTICVPHETKNTNHQIENILELQQEAPDQFCIIKQRDLSSVKLNSSIKKLMIKK